MVMAGESSLPREKILLLTLRYLDIFKFDATFDFKQISFAKYCFAYFGRSINIWLKSKGILLCYEIL